ncbi:MAG: hypothetical protein IMY71_07475 [Bacteroidetes bacterium]|nr:hypothetical protein [Bacteroidota bacterium]
MVTDFFKNIKKKKLVFIYFVDQNRAFFPLVKEKLSNEEKYRVHLFSTSDALCDHLKTSNIDNTSINIFFLNTENNYDGTSEKEKLINSVKKIKNIYPDFNVFVLTNQKDVNIHNELITAGTIGIIPKNDSSVLRILNHVKGLISEKNLEKKRKARILPLKILLFFVLLIIIIAIIAYFIHPEIFYT